MICVPVIVLFLFLMVPCADLWSVIVACPGQSHLFLLVRDSERERGGGGGHSFDDKNIPFPLNVEYQSSK